MEFHVISRDDQNKLTQLMEFHVISGKITSSSKHLTNGLRMISYHPLASMFIIFRGIRPNASCPISFTFFWSKGGIKVNIIHIHTTEEGVIEPGI